MKQIQLNLKDVYPTCVTLFDVVATFTALNTQSTIFQAKMINERIKFQKKGYSAYVSQDLHGFIFIYLNDQFYVLGKVVAITKDDVGITRSLSETDVIIVKQLRFKLASELPKPAAPIPLQRKCHDTPSVNTQMHLRMCHLKRSRDIPKRSELESDIVSDSNKESTDLTNNEHQISEVSEISNLTKQIEMLQSTIATLTATNAQLVAMLNRLTK
jgi:hypothetical protein